MKFTTSKDGFLRATVRIPFRVSIAHLETAAANIVWSWLVDNNNGVDADPELAAGRAARLSRAEIERGLREDLKQNGYAMGEAASDDDWWEVALQAATPRVHALWPELVADWTQHA